MLHSTPDWNDLLGQVLGALGGHTSTECAAEHKRPWEGARSRRSGQETLPLLRYVALAPGSHTLQASKFQQVTASERIFMAQFSNQNVAATLGLFAAPLVPTIVPAFYAGSSSPDVTSAFYGAFLIYVVSLLLGGVLGLPFFYLLGRLRLVNVWTCLLGGFLVGAIAGLLITLFARVGSDAALIYGCQGAGAAAVFWVFWRLGPDPSPTFARIWIREVAGSR
jgi:hypothetical protein